MPLNPPAPPPGTRKKVGDWASRNQVMVGFVIGQITAVITVGFAVLVGALLG